MFDMNTNLLREDFQWAYSPKILLSFLGVLLKLFIQRKFRRGDLKITYRDEFHIFLTEAWASYSIPCIRLFFLLWPICELCGDAVAYLICLLFYSCILGSCNAIVCPHGPLEHVPLDDYLRNTLHRTHDTWFFSHEADSYATSDSFVNYMILNISSIWIQHLSHMRACHSSLCRRRLFSIHPPKIDK